MLKLLLDEHISPRVAAGLRRAGRKIAVHALAEWEHGSVLGQDDALCLRAAQVQRLTLVTNDRKTIPPLLKTWAETGVAHGCVIFVDEKTISLADLDGLVRALRQLARAERMTEAMINSTARIFDLIKAIKDYSYMDQAPIQEVDLAQSLENALALLHPQLQKMVVVRDYDPGMPLVTAYGGELSQVWTALIENAIDATDGAGTLKVTTRSRGEMAFVEIWDDGAGIDAALSTRIFEPFFTTKPLGQGLGLGLDTVRRIVNKHFGSVSVQSVPHATCFQVRLPLDKPHIY